jgi:hypothetical protein
MAAFERAGFSALTYSKHREAGSVPKKEAEKSRAEKSKAEFEFVGHKFSAFIFLSWIFLPPFFPVGGWLK